MKKKKAGPRIIFASFILILCLPWAFWLLFEQVSDTANHENRSFAAMPRLRPGTYRQFAADFTSYLNDAMPFRNDLITLNSGIDYSVFHASSNDSVIIGKGDWLFYCNQEDGDPLASYQGKDLLPEDKLARMAENLVQQRDYLASLGKEFVLFIAPNKERIYSEYMPEWYGAPAENYRALQVYQYLKGNTDLRVIYAYDELMEAREAAEEDLYYKTDTHWNAVGGYIGARLLLRELGVELPAIEAGEIKITHQGQHTGDLANMLNLSRQLDYASPEYRVSGYPENGCSLQGGELLEPFSCTAEDADPRKLYMIRDSFSIAMYPYLGSQFRESCFRDYYSDLNEDFREQDPDIVVVEVVERKLEELAGFVF